MKTIGQTITFEKDKVNLLKEEAIKRDMIFSVYIQTLIIEHIELVTGEKVEILPDRRGAKSIKRRHKATFIPNLALSKVQKVALVRKKNRQEIKTKN